MPARKPVIAIAVLPKPAAQTGIPKIKPLGSYRGPGKGGNSGAKARSGKTRSWTGK